MKRRDFLVFLAGLHLTGLPAATAAQPRMKVWKSPTCGCCGAWVDHMRTAGFAVDVTVTDTMDAVKSRLGVTPSLASCHTGEVEGYVLEGHVPADAIKRLLKERPQAIDRASLHAAGCARHGDWHGRTLRHSAFRAGTDHFV